MPRRRANIENYFTAVRKLSMMAIGTLAIRQAAIIESRPSNLRTSAMVPRAWLSSIEPKVL
jgi:hypothetical protein